MARPGKLMFIRHAEKPDAANEGVDERATAIKSRCRRAAGNAQVHSRCGSRSKRGFLGRQ